MRLFWRVFLLNAALLVVAGIVLDCKGPAPSGRAPISVPRGYGRRRVNGRQGAGSQTVCRHIGQTGSER